MKKILVISTLAIILLSISIISVSAQNQYEIPSWVKGVAGFWAEGKITDADFGEGLAFLIDSEIIKVPKIQELQDRVSTLQSENADLRSKLNLPEPDDALGPEDCTSNQVWQDNQCITVSELSKNSLNLQTDKVLYQQGDVVVITGLIHNIENFSTASEVAIIVRAPDNGIVTMAQAHPNADGSFQTSLKADGPQFIAAGNYTIFVNFSGLKSQITFEFAGGNGNIISE